MAEPLSVVLSKEGRLGMERLLVEWWSAPLAGMSSGWGVLGCVGPWRGK